MNIEDFYKNSISLAQNANIINDVYKKLLDNCFSILTGKEEIHSMIGLYQSKPDAVKELYAALLSISANFARRRSSTDAILRYLSDCGLPSVRANLYIEYFERNNIGIETSLLNITGALPHVTDAKWKIDYIVKSNTMNSSDGPIFRISLVAEQFHLDTQQKKMESVNFSCTSQEMQDLVYKLKDAVRHCNSITQRTL